MSSSENRIKLIVQQRVVFFSVILFFGKIVAYYLTSSVGILTDALESTVNVLTGFISIYSISVALKPKDKDHPFGHGKIESISASIEGILIALAGIFIIFEAAQRLFNPVEVQKLDVGIVIIAVAGVVNYILGYYSIKTGKKHNSIALVAGGKHLQSDTYSTIGLVIGLVLLYVTEIVWLDSAIAFIFGAVIIYTGYHILKETSSNLMDEADVEMLNEIMEALSANNSVNWIDIHNLKLVKYGDKYHIDCDLTLPWYMNIADAHKENDKLEAVVSARYPNSTDFTIHSDACKPRHCVGCRVENCPYRSVEFDTNAAWTFKKMISISGAVRY
ncbi:MAG: hypothetical protein RIS47_2072 [Bacteroidota bacterium]